MHVIEEGERAKKYLEEYLRKIRELERKLLKKSIVQLVRMREVKRRDEHSEKGILMDFIRDRDYRNRLFANWSAHGFDRNWAAAMARNADRDSLTCRSKYYD